MRDHDPLCPGVRMVWEDDPCQCDLISEIRTDEAKKWVRHANQEMQKTINAQVLEEMAVMTVRAERDKLRGQVVALRDGTERGAWDRRDALDVVLALIDGGE